MMKKFTFLATALTSIIISHSALSYDASNMDWYAEAAKLDGYFIPPTSSEYIIPKGANGLVWDYVTTRPAADWFSTGFNSTLWSQGRGGFYRSITEPEDDRTTQVNASEIWLRSKFRLSPSQLSAGINLSNLVFWARWDDEITVYINGKLAMDYVGNGGFSKSYRYFGMSAEARQSLVQTGENTIAIYVKNTSGNTFFDLGLVNQPKMAKPLLTGSTQNAQLTNLSTYLQGAMSQYGVPAATFAVSRRWNDGGQWAIMGSYGIGYMEKEFKTPVPQNALLRLASVDKQITSYAIKRMMNGIPKETKEKINGVEYSTWTCDLSTGVTNANAVTNPATGSPLTCNDSVLDLLRYFQVFDSEMALQRLNNVLSSFPEFKDIKIIDLIYFQGYLEPRPDPYRTSTDWYYSIIDQYLYPPEFDFGPKYNSPKELMRWYSTSKTKRRGAIKTSQGPVSSYNSDDPAVLRFIIDKLAGFNGYTGLIPYVKNYLRTVYPTPDVAIAYQDPRKRERDNNGNLREPWYLMFSEPRDFDIALEVALALSASAETMVAQRLLDDGGTNYGGMRGTQSALAKFGIDGDDCNPDEEAMIQVSLNLTGERVPFGGDPYSTGKTMPNVDGTLYQLIRDMPDSAWVSPGQPRPTKKSPEGIVTNCTFASGGTGWQFYTNEGGTGSVSYTNGKANIVTSNPASVVWATQLVTKVNLTQKAKYQLSFKIKADTDRTITVALVDPDTGYKSYFEANGIKINKYWKNYQFDLPEIPVDSNARLDFNFGNAGTGTVSLDQVYLNPI